MFKNGLKYNRVGFTLAEVLITLGIIGVVASLTIPTLMQNSTEKATVVALKKTYSVLSQAYKLAELDNGSPDQWDVVAGNHMLSPLLPYLKVTKNCLDGSKGCWPPGVDYKYMTAAWGGLGVYDDAAGPKLMLADGTLIYGLSYTSDCSTPVGDTLSLQNACGIYYVDVNGFKRPNQWGIDTFLFYLTKYGIVPAGTPPDTQFRFLSDCKDKDGGNGMPCTAWLIYNNNMDYLHCNDLGWGIKLKCD